MPTVHRSARVPYAAQEMYELVDDVESYPEFLHWCRAVRVAHRDDDFIEAELDIGFRGIHKSFSTRNRREPPERIDIELVRGPFRKLQGAWRFRDLAEGGSEVTLDLEFEVARSPFGFMFSAVFEEIVRYQMRAFVERARQLYAS
jgi:ribosome-associated toxin RatA of RatAB toxin-antitoxin module